MKTWIAVDKSLLEARSNNACKSKRFATMAVFIIVVCALALSATTRSTYADISSTGTKDFARTGTELFRDLQLRLGTGDALSDEKYQGTKKLPGALLIGAKKSGTRALLEFIRVHPNVRAAGHEVHYFDRNYSYGPEWYRYVVL